ncbi:MAG: hypothetical protein OHK006_19870 [Thermodesulfovibrionales bacterium]
MKQMGSLHRRAFALVCALGVMLAGASLGFASAPAGYSEYYIPGDENNMSAIMSALGPAAPASPNMHTLISVTAWSDNTTIYYDHWENGYNFDPNNPAATADETYTLATAGANRVFESANIPIPRTTATFYDGGDRIYVAGGSVTVTRASWLEERGAGVQALAWEIYPVKPQLTTYVLSFGEDLSGAPNNFLDFLRVYVLIQATENNTTFTVDLNGDGTPDVLNVNRNNVKGDAGDLTTVTLSKGQTFLLDRLSACTSGANCLTTPGTLNTGTVIQGSSTLQLKYVIGDPGANYETRGLSAFPRGYWTKDYYAPVGQPAVNTTRNTDIFLHNPNSSAITITWETLSGTGTFTIPANSTVSYRSAVGSLPASGGVYLRGSDVFWGVSTIDSTQQAYEWAYSLLPSTLLYSEHYLGWAPDGLPVAAGNDDNGAFLTVMQDNTSVFVDFNNDGTADQSYTMNRLQSRYIYDPDGDLSGAHFWATGPFTMAYGQNPDTANTTAPALDLGYVAIPGSDFISLVLTLDKTANPQVVPTASGSQTTFTITVGSQKYSLDGGANGLTVTDYLPPNWAYVNNSATITRPDRTTVSGAAANPGIAGSTLSWTSAQLGTDGTPGMAENQNVTITFTAQTTAVLPAGTLSQNKVQAVGKRTFGTPSQTQTFTATDFAYVATGDLQVSKTSSATNPLYPGDTYTYTVTVTNPSASTITGVSIYDALPAGLSYVGPLQVSRSTVIDKFDAVSYANDNGTANWLVSWVETVETTNPAAGDIQIVNGELQLDNSSSNEPTVRRRVNTAGATSATLNFDYRTGTGVDNGDTIYIEAATADAGPFTIIGTFTGIVGAASGSFSASLNPYISANTTIRFRFANNNYTGQNEFFYVDNLVITYDLPVNNASIFPPDLINGYTLRAGQSMTLSFPVRVDSPLASGIESITNTASVTARQIPLFLDASVTNTLVNPSSQSAEIASYVWLDADGDGVKDVGEPGLANVEVILKDQFGTPIATVITDGTGRYVFTDIEPGSGYYVEVTAGTLPAGLQQSAPAGRSDNRTNAFDLAAGQSFADGNIGYEPAPGTATFGDLVWSDADADGVRDLGEPGLAGVTVQLWLDVNDNGIIEPGTDTLTNSTVTAPGGGYLFAGVAATGAEDYIVFVDVTQAALTGFTQTSTGRRARNVSPGTVITNFDFGFQNTAGTFSIRDRIWNDLNRDSQDDGEAGIAGVTVDLLDASRNVIATAVTDANGYFTFTGVIGSGADYTLLVTDTGGTLSDYFGVTGAAVAGEVAVDNLAADRDFTVEPTEPNFGFGLSRAISGAVFNDLDGNGSLDAGESGVGGVTVRLYSDVNGNGLLDGPDTLQSTLITDTNGGYLFSGLGDGNYIVSVPTPPAGYTYTTETPDNDPAAGHQQPAVVAGGGTVLGRDFGYQAITPRSVSGTIWDDSNGDGVVDAGEGRFQGVTVELLDAGVVVASTVTDANGSYSFAGFAPTTYTVRVADAFGVLAGFNAVYEAEAPQVLDGSITVDLTGGNAAGVSFGYQKPGVTRVMLADFRAFAESGRLRVQWTTSFEHNTAGFFLYRLDPKSGDYMQINRALLPALLDAPEGGTYSVIDLGASLRESQTYILVELEGRGRRNFYGPFAVAAGGGNALEHPAAFTRPSSGRTGKPAAPRVQKAVGFDGVLAVGMKGRRAAVHEVAGYERAPKAETGDRKARLKAGSDARHHARLLKKMRTGEAVKISVVRDGLYFVSAQEIAALLGISEAGTQKLIENRRLALSSQGAIVPYAPAEDGDGIFFYGQEMKGVYSRENIYWLFRGQGIGMEVHEGDGPGGGEVSTFTETVHAEQETTFLNADVHDPESDYWFWSYLYVDPYYTGLAGRTFSVLTDGAASLQAAATLTVRMKGFTDTAASPDHRVRASINGRMVGEGRFEGLETTQMDFLFDQRLLNDGLNTVLLEAVSDPGVPYSAFFLDSFDVTYRRRLQAYGGSLVFTSEGIQPVTVRGFADPDMTVFDITDPEHPVIEGAVTVSREGASSMVSFAPRAAGRRYLVASPGAALDPAEIVADEPSRLASRENAADYLIIAPSALLNAAEELAGYRQSQGYRTMVVDIEDIMDEFNYGIMNPHAIRDFLSYARREWAAAPRYVVLAGEGTFDFRNNTGFNDNLVPPMIVDTDEGLFPSDSSLADLDGDQVPDMAIGRLPVLTAEELRTVLGKIVAYEKGEARAVMMIADNADRDGNYPADSDALSLRVSPEFTVLKRHLPAVSAGAIRAEMLAGLQSGTFLVDYMGHGNPYTLADEGILRVSDVASMTNADSLFVMTAMTCAAGNFGLPGYDALAEALVLKKDGGAVAVVAASGLGLHALSRKLDEGFFNAIFVKKAATVGDALREAYRSYHAAGGAGDTLKIYNLIGDPALRLPLP